MKNIKKMLFVFNPRSGKGQIGAHLLEITDIFTKGGYEVTVHPTQAQLDAYEYILPSVAKCPKDILQQRAV